MTYSYQAINESGAVVTGEIEAASVKMAEEAICFLGLAPIKVIEAKSIGVSLNGRLRETVTKVKARELILFSKQFRSMFRSGIPIIRILTVIEKQSDNKALKNAAASIRENVSRGATLKEAMQKHPSIFSPLYCSMIATGEMSGNLPEVIERLVYILEHEDKVKSNIRSALNYPKVVVIVLGLAFFLLLGFVIPVFVKVFSKAGLNLPLPTKIAIAMHHILFGYWHIMLLGIVGIVFGLKTYFKTENGRFVKDSFLLRVPVIGPLFMKAAMSRFSSILAMLISSGVPIISAIAVLSETIGNAAISRAFDLTKSQMVEGKGISGPLENTNFFTPMVVNMIAVGEESGNLPEMLKEITMHYDEEVTHSVSRLTDLIGPVLTVALAIVVGFFALAIYLPMWDLTKMVHH